MDKLVLKGFPTEISDYIEIPDIAELLSYPMFFDVPIEDAYKYGSSFQKMLLDKVPLRGNKKNISVLCEVKLLDGFHRSCTGIVDISNNDKEWHIDCEEKENTHGRHVYHEERDIVHLFTSKTTNMTQFNKNEMILDWDHNKSYDEFSDFICNNVSKLGIIPQTMPSNRIVTFSNHLHRATPSTKLEFRFMFRVVETDRERKPQNYDIDRSSNIINEKGQAVPSVMVNETLTSIFVPSTVKAYLNGDEFNKSSNLILPAKTINKNSIKNLEICDIYWENEGLTYESRLRKAVEPNTIMLVSKGNYSDQEKNQELVDFFERLDKTVTLLDEENNKIHGEIFSNYYDEDPYLGAIAGSFVKFEHDELSKIEYGKDYRVQFNDNSEYHYTISPEITFSR